MAGYLDTDDVVHQLKNKTDHPLFAQLYKNFNLSEMDFLEVVRKCAAFYNTAHRYDYETLCAHLIKVEYSNVSLVSKAFKTLLDLKAGLWILRVMQEVTPLRDDKGSYIYLCQCVAESVWENQDSGFQLLSHIPLHYFTHSHSHFSCILERFLVLTLANQDSEARLKRLDNWICKEANGRTVSTVFQATRLDCLHFKNEVCPDEVTRRVRWCLNNGHECLAMYMLFLCQDFEGVAHFIHHYTSEISNFPMFISMLGLHPAMSNNALNVTLALFDLYRRHDKIENLFSLLKMSSHLGDFTTQLKSLIEKCREKGHYKLVMYLMIKIKDWEGLTREAQSCGDPALVDQIIKITYTEYDSRKLLDFSSKNSEIKTILLQHAIKNYDVAMISKVFENGDAMDTDNIFNEMWSDEFEFTSVHSTGETKKKAAMEMAQVLIKVGLLYKYRCWIEQHRLAQCIEDHCHGCRNCQIPYLEGVMDDNMHSVLKLLLTSDSVPSFTVHQLVHNEDYIQYLQAHCKECAELMLSYRGNEHNLQN